MFTGALQAVENILCGITEHFIHHWIQYHPPYSSSCMCVCVTACFPDSVCVFVCVCVCSRASMHMCPRISTEPSPLKSVYRAEALLRTLGWQSVTPLTPGM